MKAELSFFLATLLLFGRIDRNQADEASNDTDGRIIHAENQLFGDLLKDYNRHFRGTNITISVYFGAALIQLDNVDEKKKTITTLMWLRMLWHDERMKWDPAKYSGVTVMRIPADKIWTPDIALYNSAQQMGQLSDILINTVVYSQGGVLWIPPVILTSTCEFDLTQFPFDTQTCMLKFGSWAYDGTQVGLSLYEGMESVDLSDYIAHTEWEVINTTAKVTNKKYPCCVETFPDITFNITMRRRPGFYSYMYITPALMISILLPFTFLLPTVHTHRHILGIGSFVAMCLMLTDLDWLIPSHGSIPLLGVYYMGVFVLSCLQMVLSIIVTNIANRCRSPDMPPKLVDMIFGDYLRRIMCVSTLNYGMLSGSGKSEESGLIVQWLTIAQVLDRLLGIIFSASVVILALACLTRAWNCSVY